MPRDLLILDWGMLKILAGLFAARQRGVEDGPELLTGADIHTLVRIDNQIQRKQLRQQMQQLIGLGQ